MQKEKLHIPIRQVWKRLWSTLMTMIMVVFMLSESIPVFAATTTDKTYTISGWGYDFSGSGLPNAYDPITQSNSNNQFRYAWANQFYYFKDRDDNYCYCVQLGTLSVDGETMDKIDFDKNVNIYYPDETQLRHLRYATIYAYKGDTKYGYSWQEELVASQMMVWSVSGKFFDDSTTGLSTIENTLLNCVKAPSTAAKNNMKECYKKMKADILSHDDIPKGTVASQRNIANATYQLKYNKETLRWEAAITMNSTLSQFELPSVSGVTFTRSGSTLKVSATETGRKNLEGEVLSMKKTKAKYADEIEKCTPVFLKAQRRDDASQAKVSYTWDEDPVSAYFRLESATGNLRLTKQLLTSGGQLVDGTGEQYNDILFQISHLDEDGTRRYLTATKNSDGVYTYSGSTTDDSKGLYRVGENGTLIVYGLPAGTFNLSEYQTADGYKTAGDVHITISADKTTRVTVKNSGTGENVNIYKTVNDWEGTEIEDTSLLEDVYSETKFRAYIVEDNTRKYITAELDNQTGSDYDSERYFVYNYTGLTSSANSATVFNLYDDYDGYYNTSYSFFGTARIKGVPESFTRIYFEEIRSSDNFGTAGGSSKISTNRSDVNFTNQAYTFTAGFNKYEDGTTTFLSDGVFGLYAAENIYLGNRLIYAADQEIERVTSDGETTYFTTLLPAWGTYYIREIEAPEGFIKDETEYEVKQNLPTTLTNSRLSNVVLNIENEEIRFAISKQDAYGEEIVGAQMQLIDEDGGVVDEWTSDGTEHIVSGLSAGNYTLHEYFAPDGYCIATDIAVTIDEYGKIFADNTEVTATSTDGSALIVMIDQATKVQISKQDITGEGELPGASLQVIDKDGNVVEEWVSTNEPHYIEAELIAGETYTLHEVAAPDGYVIANDVEFTVNEDGTVTQVVMIDDTTKVQISKQDITNSAELPGASLQIIDKDGNIVDEWVSTDEPHYIEAELIAGETYTLHEVAAPDGYVIANDVEFTVNEDGTVTQVVMIDDTTKVQISKQDITNSAELPGASLQVIDKDGIVVDEWISTDKPHYIEAELIAGETYTLRETIAPTGFALTSDMEFTVNTDGSVNYVVMYNSDATGTVQIQKRTEGMMNIEGITLILSGTSDSGHDVYMTAVTDENGIAVFTPVPVGTYTVTEDGSTVPVAYMVADQLEVTVFEAESTTAEIYNGEKTGSIEVNKTTVGMINLDGIEFTLSGTSDSGREIELTAITDANGIAMFTDVPIGTYTITESAETTPYAYLTADPQEVSVFYAETTSIEISNAEKTGFIQVQKQTEGMTDLEGIEFILSGTSDSGREIELTAVTDANGIAMFTDVPIGTYTITENGDTVPTGYLVADDQTVQVFYTETTDVVVTNEKIPEAPDSTPVTGAAVAGIPAILILGGVILSVRKKFEK